MRFGIPFATWLGLTLLLVANVLRWKDDVYDHWTDEADQEFAYALCKYTEVVSENLTLARQWLVARQESHLDIDIVALPCPETPSFPINRVVQQTAPFAMPNVHVSLGHRAECNVFQSAIA